MGGAGDSRNDMGDAARRAYLRRTRPEQWVRDGFSLCDLAQRIILERAGIVPDGTEATARRAVKALRQAGE